MPFCWYKYISTLITVWFWDITSQIYFSWKPCLNMMQRLIFETKCLTENWKSLQRNSSTLSAGSETSVSRDTVWDLWGKSQSNLLLSFPCGMWLTLAVFTSNWILSERPAICWSLTMELKPLDCHETRFGLHSGLFTHSFIYAIHIFAPSLFIWDANKLVQGCWTGTSRASVARCANLLNFQDFGIPILP